MKCVIFTTDTGDQQLVPIRFDTNDGYSTICTFLHYFPVNNFPVGFGSELRDTLFSENEGIIDMHVEAGWLRIKCLREECQDVLKIIGRMRLFVCHEGADYSMHIYPPEEIPRIEFGLDTNEQITTEAEFVTILDSDNWFLNTKDIRFINSVRTQAKWRNRFTVGPRNGHVIAEKFLSFRKQRERVWLVVNPFDEVH